MTAYFKAGSFNSGKYGLSWHKGELAFEPVVDGDNVTDAMAKAKILDVHVGTYPTYIHVGDQVVKTDNDQLVMTNCGWMDNGIQQLNRAVSWYTPIQNAEYAEILNPLTKSYPVAGVLMCGKYGEVLAIQLELPEFTIAGRDEELHKGFLMVSEDRKLGLKIYGSVATRVVCANTYNAAISEKGNKSLPNCQDSHAMLQFRTRIEEKAIANQQQFIQNMNHLFTKKVGNKEIDNLLTELFPEPKKPQMVELWQDNQDVLNGDAISQTVDKRGQRALNLFENAIERKERYEKELVENFFKFNDEQPYAANTAYGLFQATTQFFNHSEEWQSDEATHNYNLLFGEKAKLMAKAQQILSK